MNNNINPMSENDDEAILWLTEHSKDNAALANAWSVLKDYYDRCKTDLKKQEHLKFRTSISDTRDRMYGFVLRNLKSSKAFCSECIDFFDGKYTVEELLDFASSKDKNNPEIDDIIIKMARLYNMRLKLGHSARITYIASYELDKLIGDKESENYDLLRQTVVLSALLHDIGRFYQASHYNVLSDEVMRSNEKEIEGLRVDHAIAGYYYSIAQSLKLHKASNDAPSEDLKKYIEEAVAATVVRFHQQSNKNMPHFDYSGNVDELESENNLVPKMSDFISLSYANAKVMNKTVSFDKEHKEFIDAFMDLIFKNKTINYDMADSFEIDFASELVAMLNNILVEVLKNSNSKSVEDVYEDYMKKFNEFIGKSQKIQLSESDIESCKPRIIKALEGMLSFDIASSIDMILKDDNMDVDKSIRLFMSKSMSITTDADKIDIFNQRALGIYNSEYKMSTYEIFPVHGKSFKEMLEEYFGFKLGDYPIKLDEDIIRVINGLNRNVLSSLRNTLFKDLDIFDENNKIKSNISIIVDEGNVSVVDKTNNNSFDYQTNAFNEFLDREYIGLICEKCNIPNDMSYKEFKSKNLGKLLITVNTDDIEKNLDRKGLSFDEKVEFYKRIVITDGIVDRFSKESDNRPGNGWIIDSENSDHVVSSGVTAFLWQLNQFIFVNMRNLYSFEFIRDNHILENIVDQYKKKGALVESKMLEDYVDYALSFVNKAIAYCYENNVDSLTQEDLKKIKGSVPFTKKEEQVNNKNNINVI